MPAAPDPIRPTDDAARALAREVLEAATSAALATLQPDGTPLATRIAFVLAGGNTALSLVSDLAAHTRALRHAPRCSLLLGAQPDRGDPLVHPRLTLQATAGMVPHGHAEHAKMATQYLRGHPKAKLYIGFADFSLVRFTVHQGLLNGGFGRAFHLTAQDMGLTG